MPLYYWVTFFDREGFRRAMGPFADEFQAQRKADKLEFDADIVPLRTRDKRTAVNILKTKRIGDVPFEEAIKHFRHKGNDEFEIY